MELSKEGLSTAFDFYYQFNPKLIEKVHGFKVSVREKSLFLSTKDPATSRVIRHVVKIAEDAADLNPLTTMRQLK